MTDFLRQREDCECKNVFWVVRKAHTKLLSSGNENLNLKLWASGKPGAIQCIVLALHIDTNDLNIYFWLA